MNSPQPDAAARVALVLITAVLLLGAIGLLGFGLAVGVNPLEKSVGCHIVGQDSIQTPQPFHDDGRSALTRSEGFPSDALGGLSGKRQSEVRTVGFVLSVRPPNGGSITRGGFLLFGDVRSYYGAVKPHLVLCRLQN